MEQSRNVGLGISSILGALLFAVSTVFHPITIDPWQPSQNLHKVNQHLHIWSWDHAALAIALVLWLLGLSGVDHLPDPSPPLLKISSRLFMTSLGIWLVVLANELGVIPPIVRALQHNSNNALTVMGGAMFTFSLLGGYFAMELVWVGVFLIGLSMRMYSRCPRWLAHWAVLGGMAGVLGNMYTVLFPAGALIILAITSIIPYAWTIAFAWRMTFIPTSA